MEKEKIAYLYDNGLQSWSEDEDGNEIVESSDKRKVYFQTQAMGFKIVDFGKEG